MYAYVCLSLRALVTKLDNCPYQREMWLQLLTKKQMKYNSMKCIVYYSAAQRQLDTHNFLVLNTCVHQPMLKCVGKMPAKISIVKGNTAGYSDD